MTKNDMIEILYAIEVCKQEERDLCYKYCKLNPEHARQRQAERDLILEGMDRAWNEIKTRYEEDEKYA